MTKQTAISQINSTHSFEAICATVNAFVGETLIEDLAERGYVTYSQLCYALVSDERDVCRAAQRRVAALIK